MVTRPGFVTPPENKGGFMRGLIVVGSLAIAAGGGVLAWVHYDQPDRPATPAASVTPPAPAQK